MRKCRISVLKRTFNAELANEYCASETTKCPVFVEGQQFIAGFEQPEGFCGWAWNDLYKYVTAMIAGADFSSGAFEGWMKNPDTMITCCTDGIRPVVFKLETIEINRD